MQFNEIDFRGSGHEIVSSFVCSVFIAPVELSATLGFLNQMSMISCAIRNIKSFVVAS